MHDIKAIRADPAAFRVSLARRGPAFAPKKELSATDFALRSLEEDIGNYRSRLKILTEEIFRQNKQIKSAAEQFQSELPISESNHPSLKQLEFEEKRNKRRVESINATIPYLEEAAGKAALQLQAVLATLPNLPASDVPNGLDETGNVVIHTCGTVTAFDFAPKEHDTLALRFGYDPDAAAAISGARFAVLRGPLARLHRAIGQFMLDANVAAGWTEVAPPLMVRAPALFGTGQLPKFEDDLFKTTGDNPHYLIPTAEVSLTNSIRGRVLDADELPLRLTALTPCFRAEAGSAGRDTRGLIRQHQFDKVELVAIVADAEAAAAMHEEMTAQAESLLDALGLPFRRILLCAGDMGFAARKTYDLEVWLPGQGAYREISSISDCGDFQARRMDVDEPKGGRFKVRGQKGTQFVHTLNGSALAVGRTLVAAIENYQRADGSVRVPDILAPYMGGVTELTPN